ncbi:MAG: hypothetical protein MEQ74_09555 [Paracoccus sp.]|nr:hypothetical protein [Paracoccus sp. (in: a-proteobacteria)]
MSKEAGRSLTIAAWQSKARQKKVTVVDQTVMTNSSGLLIMTTIGSADQEVCVTAQVSLEAILKLLPKMVAKAEKHAVEKALKGNHQQNEQKA